MGPAGAKPASGGASPRPRVQGPGSQVGRRRGGTRHEGSSTGPRQPSSSHPVLRCSPRGAPAP
eukprot:5829371-Alexandrium_andersonii.AAC.1